MSHLPFFNDTIIPDVPIHVQDLMRMFKEFEWMKLRHQDLEGQLQLVKNDNESIKLKLHQTENKVNRLEQQLLQHNIMSHDHEAQTLQERWLTLQFKNGPCQKIYTGKGIKADDGAPLELELVDADSRKVVDSGPLANSEVDIVVLKGDDGNADNWTPEEFNRKIVRQRKGTKLGGNVTLKLNKGIGVIGDLKFVSSAKPMPQGVFKLGARMVGTYAGIHVREGKTESFIVEDYRNERYEKHETPALVDKLCRLKNIAPKGKVLKNLKGRQITSVKDFLVQLFKDPEELKQMAGLPKQKWEETVKNARNCLDKRLCYYIDPDMNMTVVFSLIDQVLGIVSSSHYIPVETLPHNVKENARKLAVRALDDWANVLFADDVPSILNSMNISISREQENPIELQLEASGIICNFGDSQFDATGFLSSDNCDFNSVSQEQPAAPYHDHISLANNSVGSTSFQGQEHPLCLEIAPFRSHGKYSDTGFNPTSGMHLSNNHDMVMPNVMNTLPNFNFKDLLRGIASSSFDSSSDLVIHPLRPQEEAIENFNHWHNIQGSSTWMVDELQPLATENLCRTSSSSTNMALVRTIPWRSWLIVTYILSVRWGLLRSDIVNLAKIEDLLTRWDMLRVSMVNSLDDLAFLSATIKFKKPRTQ